MSVFNETLGSMSRYQSDPNYNRDEARDIRCQFVTREGTYKLLNHSEYARPTRLPMTNGTASTNSNLPVKVSLVRSKDAETNAVDDRLCFNIGKEIYVYPYNGIKKAADLTHPLDKRLYRGTSPTCHDFNSCTARTDHLMLVIGFSAGQVQLVDPVGKEFSKLFNEDRLIDKTKVTCIKWLPGSPNQFLVSHLSGQLYVYQEELPCSPTAPTYQLFKQGQGFSVYTCKAKSTRNPLYRWHIDGSPGINEFSFSPCSRYMAMACQDGFLRVYNFNEFELLNKMKSYFGGLLCVCWSPDSKYVATGGEDDLVTVWSFHEARVVCRGRGHSSWVNVVAFDSYNTLVDGESLEDVMSDEDDDYLGSNAGQNNADRTTDGPIGRQRRSRPNSSCCDKSRTASESEARIASYRFGSVGQDTRLCLWDLTEDILKQASTSTLTPTSSATSAVPMSPADPKAVVSNEVVTPVANSASALVPNAAIGNHRPHDSPRSSKVKEDGAPSVPGGYLNLSSTLSSSSGSSLSTRLTNQSTSSDASDTVGKKQKSSRFQKGYGASTLPGLFGRHSNNSARQQNNSTSTLSKSSNQNASTGNHVASSAKLLGTQVCPGLHDVPLIEPLTCKKIAHERLTSLLFLEDCFVTSCQEGTVYTWARPGKTPHSTASNISNANSKQQHNSLNS